MTVKQAVDDAMMDGMAKSGFEGSLNLMASSNLSFGLSLKERGEEGGFVGKGQVLVASSAFARGVEGIRTKAVVARDDGADDGDGDTSVKGDALGRARLDQGIVDDTPTGALGDVGSGIHLALDCVCREMGSGLGDSSHLTSRDDYSTISS